jgi:hypothetical protein
VESHALDRARQYFLRRWLRPRFHRKRRFTGRGAAIFRLAMPHFGRTTTDLRAALSRDYHVEVIMHRMA